MIVLDTHAWFWLVASPDRLSKAGAIAIDGSDELGISAISCWEIAMLVEKGRIEIDRPARQWLEDALGSTGTVLLPIEPAVAAELLTKDQQIRASGLVSTIW